MRESSASEEFVLHADTCNLISGFLATDCMSFLQSPGTEGQNMRQIKTVFLKIKNMKIAEFWKSSPQFVIQYPYYLLDSKSHYCWASCIGVTLKIVRCFDPVNERVDFYLS